ncbi:MAG: His/Gly/Thr/Pro-type tRNA ligase C-terminal domain-containing protein, partial [Culicoidibacterales bacterium]
KLSEPALEVYAKLAKDFMVEYDEAGTIGKRYRRQDAIGTPFCITVDYETLENQTVTVRHRDTMEQTRVHIDELKAFIDSAIAF